LNARTGKSPIGYSLGRIGRGDMRYRKLRIAWSVAWGVVALLLCVLWVRSYWWADNLYIKVPDPQRNLIIFSGLGGTIWYTNEYPSWSPAWTHTYWRTQSNTVAAETEGIDVLWFHSLYRFEFFNPPREPYWSRQLVLPHWFLITAFTAIAAAPWLRWRFSLRTLLIVTTLVAVGLGLIVYAVR
jgi:hypothetical protein